MAGMALIKPAPARGRTVGGGGVLGVPVSGIGGATEVGTPGVAGAGGAAGTGAIGSGCVSVIVLVVLAVSEWVGQWALGLVRALVLVQLVLLVSLPRHQGRQLVELALGVVRHR